MTDPGYTRRATAALTLARTLAGTGEQTTAHLLRALSREAEGLAGRVLATAGIAEDRLADAASAAGDQTGEFAEGRLDRAALAGLGIDLDVVRGRLDRALGQGALDRAVEERALDRAGATRAAMSGALRRTLVAASAERRRLRHRFVGTEHLLLGLLAQRDSIATAALTRLGVAPAALAAETEALLSRLAAAKA